MALFADRYFVTMETARSGIAGVSADLHKQGLEKVIRPWFSILHWVIQATTPLLQFSLKHLADHPVDPFTKQLREFYEEKLDDEEGHELLLIEDLARLGMTKDELTRQLPPSPITALVGSQYYLIAHHHPALHLGYIGLLEGFALDQKEVQVLSSKAGTSADIWGTYRLHAELDPGHTEELKTILNAVPADAALQSGIMSNGIRTAESYCQALELLLESGE